MTVLHEKIEPGANSWWMRSDAFTAGEAFQLSLAISMKRIADAIDGSPEKFGLVQGVMEAIETGLFKASNR